MRRFALAAAAAVALGLGACGSGPEATGDEETIVVGAASSLGESFEQIAEDFEQEHPDVEVRLTFSGSANLAAQIDAGADYDVFASADESNMDRVSDLVDGQPQTFATNTLTIVTEPGNPEQVSGLQDLADEQLEIVVCAPRVPCGAAAQDLADREGVDLAPDSEESKVTDVLAKVRTGQADAGLVYATDAARAGEDVDSVTPKGADAVVNEYPIARLDDSGAPDAAQAFIDHVTGPEGRKVLRQKGFGAP